MKKIPSVFDRDWNGDRSRVLDKPNPECAWVLAGEGTPTRKRDGTACLVRDGKLYKRFDCKKGKTAPPGFAPCGDPDPMTGHHPGWLPVGDGPEDQWHRSAPMPTEDGTYELIGPKLQGNPEGEISHRFIRHGAGVLDDCVRSFAGIEAFLRLHCIEGIVYHHSDGRMSKIKAKDFGLEWPRGKGGAP